MPNVLETYVCIGRGERPEDAKPLNIRIQDLESLVTKSQKRRAKSMASTEERQSSSSTLHDSLARDGFVVIPSFYSQSEVDRLRQAASIAINLARTGKWPFVRTLPKQFPPWTSDISSGIWGVQHLLHPEMPYPARSVFLESYFQPRLLSLIREILSDADSELGEADLVLELYNLLIRPNHNFELRWHRDGIPRSATDAEELDILHRRIWHTQWNAALYSDHSLIVIPGSHLRARTQAEREADEYSKDLENIKIVELKAGDIVFYNNNILHRGVYDAGRERMVLHGSVGCVKGGNGRARNVLQHGVGDWVGEMRLEGLEGEERVSAEGMRKRLIELGSENREVDYLHDG